MAVKIRLSRIGKKNHPYWRIVAVDSRAKRDGACLADLGTYDPIKHTVITMDHDGIKSWLSKGAQLSDSARKLIKRSKQSV
jgi:small subunit ribosomal protein S16